MDAKAWLVKLQQEEHRGYSSIQTIRGVLRPAFAMAVEDDLLVKNPFDFMLCDVIVNDSVRREAITAAQMREFLRFVGSFGKTDISPGITTASTSYFIPE